MHDQAREYNAWLRRHHLPAGGLNVATFTDASLTKVASLNSAVSERDPWLDPSATVLYFTSYSPGGLGNGDLWITTRGSPSGTFGTAVPLPGVNSVEEDQDPWLSPDLKTIYFSSNRGAHYDLFVATR